MYIQRNTKRVGDKIYHSVVLREGYRENGKVKHKTLLNLSNWKTEMVSALERILKGESFSSLGEIEVESGVSFGCLYALKALSDRLGITTSLGTERKAALVLLMIFARIITQGSKAEAVRWANGQATVEVLRLSSFDEDDLYESLDWLDKNQGKIENRLFGHRSKNAHQLFLYDVTSSYLEGEKNELAEYGYNRDGKKGKKQIVIGLLTDEEGRPVSVEVFSGNTQDTKTLKNQIDKLSARFGTTQIVLVGDRGMIKTISVEMLAAHGFSYITAITKPEIEALIEEGALQLSLFDCEIAEIEADGVRYIVRKNAVRADEIKRNRNERLEKAKAKLKEEADSLLATTRRDPAKALRRAILLVDKLKLSRFIDVDLDGRHLIFRLNEEALTKAESLDGCYCLKTDLAKEELSAKEVHERYKDLALVERAFRTMKTGLLELRPIFHRKASRTRGHVFITMLAYMLTHEIKRLIESTGLTVAEVISTLDRLQMTTLTFNETSIKRIAKPDSQQSLMLTALDVELPQRVPSAKVATKSIARTA